MTEAEWQACIDPDAMLTGRDISDRKLRLFACACCRRVWHLIQDLQCRTAVEIAEQFADGNAGTEELEQVRAAAQESQPLFGTANRAAVFAAASDRDHVSLCPGRVAECLAYSLCEAQKANAWAANRAGAPMAEQDAAWARYDEATRKAFTVERGHQADLLRELVLWTDAGEEVAAQWTGDVLRLAESLYVGEDCAFALHDALLDAAQADLACHFAAGTHPKGCWVVDLILGKT